MRKILSAWTRLLIVAFVVFWAPPCLPQNLDNVFDRILNPLPDYDPFEPALSPPQFFPDAVDKVAGELLVDALLNQPNSLKEHLRFLKEEDDRLRKKHGTSTGLADHAQDLINNTINDREAYLNVQKQAIKNASSAQRKKYLQSIIDSDDLNQADHLTKQSSTAFWAGVMNRMLGSVDLAGVAAGNYVGAAAETFINQMYALANRDMSVEDRRALARHLDHVKRFSNDPKNVEIQKRIETLETTKRNALVSKQIDKAEEAISKRDLDRALFHAELAGFMDPQSKQAASLLKKITTLQQAQTVTATKGLAAAAEKQLSEDQQRDFTELLSALTLRDPVQIERAAIALDQKNRGGALAASAIDAEAVAMEIRGKHDVARKLLERLSRSASNPDAQKRAAALLQSPDYNLLASFQGARTERRLESMKYVLMGDDLLKRNLLYAAGAMAAAGPAGALTLGAANALMIGNNLLNVLTNNPVPAQSIIDAGVAYVRSHPESESTSEVYKVLAEAYEERGMVDKAITFHQLAGSPKDKITSLEEKAAKALLAAAEKSKSRDAQEHYLTTLIDSYPGSSPAAEATKKLAALAKSDSQGLRMSKQFLAENPDLSGAEGLGLKRSLFDGNLANMELADRGVTLVNDSELIVYYKTPWGTRSQSYSISKKSADRFFAALRQKNQEVALADAAQRPKGSIGGIKNLPMPILHGTTGSRREKPEENDDAAFALVREAGEPSNYTRVLDHALLSENEREPAAKYKLPPIQGSVSASRFSMTGALPTGLWGNQIAIGSDPKSPFAGVQLPIPLLDGFIPVDFMVHGRPGGFSVYPRIHTQAENREDDELYR